MFNNILFVDIITKVKIMDYFLDKIEKEKIYMRYLIME